MDHGFGLVAGPVSRPGYSQGSATGARLGSGEEPRCATAGSGGSGEEPRCATTGSGGSGEMCRSAGLMASSWG
jgi:hypothetical protein